MLLLLYIPCSGEACQQHETNMISYSIWLEEVGTVAPYFGMMGKSHSNIFSDNECFDFSHFNRKRKSVPKAKNIVITHEIKRCRTILDKHLVNIKHEQKCFD